MYFYSRHNFYFTPQSIDLYAGNTQYIDVNVSGLSPGNHKFELRAKNQKNPSSFQTRISFDGWTDNKARYQFNGVGIKYFANKNNNYGMVDVWLDGNKYGTYDLYSPTLQEGQEIVSINGLNQGNHIIEFIPSGRKNNSSSGYNVNIDYLQKQTLDNQRIATWVALGSYVYFSKYNEGNNTWSSPTTISTTSNDNEKTNVSLDGNTIIWLHNDFINPGYAKNVYVSKYNGSSWSSPVNASNLTSGSITYIALSGDGNTIAYIRNDGKIFILKYNGSTWVNTFEDIGKFNTPSLSYDGNIVTWTKDDYKVYSSMYNGSSWSTPTLVSTNATALCLTPKINQDGNTIVWEHESTSQDIYVSKYNGSSWSSPTKLSISHIVANPAISQDGNTVVWYENNVYDYQIYFSRYNGSSWSTRSMISDPSDPSYSKYDPSIDLTGNYVAWKSSTGSNSNIGFSKYTSSWNTLENISPYSTHHYNVKISSDGKLIVWQGYNNSSQAGVFAMKYDDVTHTWSSPTMIHSGSAVDTMVN